MVVDRFAMNGFLWKVEVVDQNDDRLVDRTDNLRVATTDPVTKTVCISNELSGNFLMTVFIHELGHCALWSYGFLEEIRRMVYPKYWIDMEEFICNFLADFGTKIFQIAYAQNGYAAWKQIPKAYEKIFAA